MKLVPEFVVELLSPSDRLPAAKKEDGRVDGERRGFKAGCSLAGEGPVAGFVLELIDIWEGL